jgi:hypothetical protein
MKQDLSSVSVERIEERIHAVRGQRVMLDADFARSPSCDAISYMVDMSPAGQRSSRKESASAK